jgi:hypothetical protein
MTKDKIFFFFHKYFYDSLRTLSDQTRLRFYEYIFQYAFEGIEPELTDFEKAVWDGFKSTIDTDEEKWEAERQARSEAGKKGNEKRWGNRKSDKEIAKATTSSHSDKKNRKAKESIAERQELSQSDKDNSNATKNIAINKDNNNTRNINITRNNNNNDDDEEKKNCCCSSSSFNLEFFRIDIKSFVNEWDMVYDGVNSAKWKTPMQKIDELDAALPVDAQDRLDRLVCEIVQYIKTEDADILYQKLCGKNFPEGYELTDKVVKALCNRVIERALLKLAWAKIKPKTSIFGSFVWFMKFDNVKKLINGEIV